MVNILGANSVSGGYEIDNSLRFNDGDSPKLGLAFGSGGNTKTWTASCWFKRGIISSRQSFLNVGSSGSEYMSLYIDSDDKLYWVTESGGNLYRIGSSALFRDPSAWYHIVFRQDTTDGTANNRFRYYINGAEVDTGAFNAQPTQNFDGKIGGNDTHYIGSNRDGDGEFMDGYLTEYHYLDGISYDPTYFGEFDDNGVWIPKKYTGSYGTKGFYLEFKQTGTSANSSGIGADTSGNDNHWTPTNLAATDVTTDTPTNNFATVNPLGGATSSGKWTFSEGNTQIQQNDNGNWRATGSTMAVANGKWYWEIVFYAGTMSEIFVGVHGSEVSLEGTNRWVAGSTLFYNHEGGEIRQDGTNTTADYGVLTAGDILGVALNMDDKQISFYDNGSAIVSNFALSSSITGFAMPTFMSDASNIVYKVNFGNPAFAISSGNADANGYGDFEYAVPSGYYSLCTKNLGEFG